MSLLKLFVSSRGRLGAEVQRVSEETKNLRPCCICGGLQEHRKVRNVMTPYGLESLKVCDGHAPEGGGFWSFNGEGWHWVPARTPDYRFWVTCDMCAGQGCHHCME